MFAQRDMQQSTLMEIPIDQAIGQMSSIGSHDGTPILEESNHLQAVMHEINQIQDQIKVKAGTPLAVRNSLENAARTVMPQTSIETEVVSTQPVIGQVRARYNYKAQNDDEISFQKGDVIKVVKKDELWWVGYVDPDKIGYFPLNYVTEIE